MDERIKPNELHKISTEAGDFMVCAAYDTIHRFPWLDMSIAKIVQDDGTVANLYLLEEGAVQQLHETTGVPIAEREFIYQREYDGYLDAMGMRLEEVFEDIEWNEDGE